MKTEWFVANVTAIRSPDRAERAILGVIWLGIFWPIQAVFADRETLCEAGIPSSVLIT